MSDLLGLESAVADTKRRIDGSIGPVNMVVSCKLVLELDGRIKELEQRLASVRQAAECMQKSMMRLNYGDASSMLSVLIRCLNEVNNESDLLVERA